MPHINGWHLGSPITSRIGAPPETRPYRPRTSENVRPDKVKEWIAQRHQIARRQNKQKKENIRMKRRIVALESASYKMALNAQVQTQAYPASYVPRPPPSVQNSRLFSRRSSSNNRKNRIVWKSKPSSKKSPRWEQGIIGRLLSKDEKSRCVLYGQRKHEINEKSPMVEETATKQKVHKSVKTYEIEAGVDEENSYADNDFEDDDDDDDKMQKVRSMNLMTKSTISQGK